MVQSNYMAPAEPEMGYGQILSVLWRRKLWLVGGMALSLGLAAYVTTKQKPSFISTMQLLVEPNYQGKQSSNSDRLKSEFSDPNVEVDPVTQIKLMQSSEILQKAMAVVQKDYPEFDPESPASVAKFKQAISVSQITGVSGETKKAGTKIFQITYQDQDPEKTQQVLAALGETYKEYNRDQQRKRLDRGLEFVTRQLPVVKQELQRSEAKLETFRASQDIIDPELQAKSQMDALNRVLQELQTTAGQIKDLQSRYVNLQSQVGASTQEALLASRLSQSARYQSLLGEIQKTELELVQQRLKFKDKAPFVQKVIDQRQRQLGLLQDEAQRALGDQVGQLPVGELLNQGQLGALDVTLVNQYVETQSGLQAAQGRYQLLQAAESDIRSQLRRFPQLLAEYGRIQPEVELNRASLRELLKAKQEIGIEMARGGFDWQVVESAQLGAQMGPNLMRNLLLGGVAGLMLGGLAAFAREAGDDSVHTLADLKTPMPLPLLGIMPDLGALNGGANRRALPLAGALSGFLGGGEAQTSPSFQDMLQWRPFREALDLLYQNLQMMGNADPLKSLVVTSALAGEGKSTLALALAISAARLHQRVLLIDADLRNPSLHQLLNIPNSHGLSTLLASGADIPTQMTGNATDLRSNISVLTAGPTPSDPAKLLSSKRLQDAMRVFEQNYDLVILDAPPVLGMVDAMLAANSCEGVVMVGRMGRVTRTEFTQAIAMLSKLNILGVVGNGAPLRHEAS
jgi:polysaccharide biosynthesis transport protein